MTVGGSQRFYVVVQANSGEQAALLWECVWQVGARVLALADGQQPRYLPQDQRTITYGQVSRHHTHNSRVEGATNCPDISSVEREELFNRYNNVQHYLAGNLIEIFYILLLEH